MKFNIASLGESLLLTLRSIIFISRIIRSNTLSFIYKISCNKWGKNSKIQHGVYIDRPKSVSVLNNVFISSHVRMGSEIKNSTLNIGNGVQINRDVLIDYTGNLVIEEGALISEQAMIYTHDHGYDPRSKPIAFNKTIGRNSWIGSRATILPTCTVIGEGSIIAANSVVTRNVAPYTIVAGNPARVIRNLKQEH